MTNIFKAIWNYDTLKERLQQAEAEEQRLKQERNRYRDDYNASCEMRGTLSRQLLDESEKRHATEKKLQAVRATCRGLNKKIASMKKAKKDSEEGNVVWLYNKTRCEWQPYAKAIVPLAFPDASPWLVLKKDWRQPL